MKTLPFAWLSLLAIIFFFAIHLIESNAFPLTVLHGEKWTTRPVSTTEPRTSALQQSRIRLHKSLIAKQNRLEQQLEDHKKKFPSDVVPLETETIFICGFTALNPNSITDYDILMVENRITELELELFGKTKPLQ